jgi:hypothetical protein
MKSKLIVIEVSGGVVTNVYADINNLNVVIADWDNMDEATSKNSFTGTLPAGPLHSMSSELSQAVSFKS